MSLAALSLGLAVGWAWWTSFTRPPGWPQVAGPYTWLAAAAGQILRFLYFVGFPYLGLISGLLTPRLLGLKGLEHFGLVHLAGIGVWPGSDVQHATTLMLVEWLVDISATVSLGLAALALWLLLLLSLARHGVDLAPARPASLVGGLYDSLHWTFYRAIAWLLSGDLYLGVVWGAAVALLEGALVAWFQPDHRRPGYLVRAMILLITSVIFLYSPNWWLLLPVHLLMLVMVRGVNVRPKVLYRVAKN